MAILSSERNREQEKGFFEFTHGVDLDQHLFPFELKVQRAWLQTLKDQKVIDDSELGKLLTRLDQMEKEMETGEFQWDIYNEDIHMNIEADLTRHCGDIGKKIHLGRSRNDLIATTLRLYTADSLSYSEKLLNSFLRVVGEKAGESIDTIVPAMTHRQSAQPMRLSHFWLHYGFALVQEREKLERAKKNALNQMPLGSSAVCGTTLDLDLNLLAQELGFESGPWSAYHSISDRSFMLDAISGYASVSVVLSRLCEDLIYWSSTPIGLFQLPRRWSSGSSIMPNKRNPDIPELARARCAQLIGKNAAAFCLTKGLPSSYSGDLHELKRVLIESHTLFTSVLQALTGFVSQLTASSLAAEKLMQTGHILATDIANDLVQKGPSFRDAYHQVAHLVETGEARKLQVHQISDSTPTLEEAVEMKNCQGGTSRQRTLESIERLKSFF